MLNYFFLLFLLFFSPFSFSQENNPSESFPSIPSGKADTNKINLLIEFYRKLPANDLNQIIATGEKIINLSRDINYKKGEAAGRTELGNFYRKLKKYDEAITQHEKAEKLFETLKMPLAAGWSKVEIGNDYFWKEEYSYAIEFYFKALNDFKSLKYVHGQSTCLNNLAMIYETRKDYDNALKNYQTSLEFYKGLNLDEGIAWSHSGIGKVKVIHKDFQKGLEEFKMALNIYTKLKINAEIADICQNIGSTFLQMKWLDSAEVYLIQAQKLFVLENRKSNLTDNYCLLANVYKERGNPEPALSYYEKSFKLFKELKSKEPDIRFFHDMADLYRGKNDFKNALKFAEEALTTSINSGDAQEILFNYILVSDLYAQSKQYERAYYYQKLYVAMKDSLSRQEKELTSMEMENIKTGENKNLKRIIQTQEMEIRELKKSMKDREFRSKRNSQMKNIFILLCLLLIIYLVFRMYKKRK